MGLIDSINKINNTTITAQKKKEELKSINKKIDSILYDYFVECFEEAGGGAEGARVALLENKKEKIKNLTFGVFTPFEISTKYDKILNQVYKNYKSIENFQGITKKDIYIYLYNTLEDEYKRHKIAAFDILNDITVKDNIIEKISRLYACSNIEINYIKKEYIKINKLLYKEYKNYKTEEKNETLQIQKESYFIKWLKCLLYLTPFYIILIIIKILNN